MDRTDRRTDDLAKRMDDGFREVRGDIKALEAKVDGKFDQVHTEIFGLHRLIIHLVVGLFLALVGMDATGLID